MVNKEEQENYTIEELKKLNQELEEIINSCHDGICVFDNKGFLIKINKAAERIAGVDSSMIIGKNSKTMEKEGIFDEGVTQRVLKEKRTVTIIQTVRSGKHILVTGTPILNEKNEIIRVVNNLRDITELIALKEELERSRKLNTRYQQELNQLRIKQAEYTNIIANSKKMQEILELVIRLAQIDTTILIQGETGVGKEVIANFIYQVSKKNGSLIKINCATIPNQLLESELFGYEAGAFTGAKRNGKPGVFELAHGGILFLDEISELPFDLQAKLLRVLQDKEFLKLGGTKPIKVDVQIVAATNKDLRALVKEGKFREDLFYRLNVLPVTIPPLRERKEDIIPLVLHYLKIFNSRYNQQKIFSSEALNMLLKYQWPGNVRELSSVVERIVVSASEEIVTPEELAKHIEVQDGKKDIKIQELTTLKETIEKIEKEMVIKAFETYGNTYKAAKELGISQATMVRKLKKYRSKPIPGNGKK